MCSLAEGVQYHWVVTTQATFCGRKRRLRTEPGSTVLTVADVGLCKGGFAEMQTPLQNPTSATEPGTAKIRPREKAWVTGFP